MVRGPPTALPGIPFQARSPQIKNKSEGRPIALMPGDSQFSKV